MLTNGRWDLTRRLRLARYCNFPDISVIHKLCIVPSNLMARPNHLICHFLSCSTFPAMFVPLSLPLTQQVCVACGGGVCS
jgi:hypothetical protein